MSSLASRVRHVLRNYVFRRVGDDPSPITYWYLPEPPRVVDQASLTRYLAETSPSPLFLMDYGRKLEYALTNAEGIPVLAYEPPIGRQVNPEVAFQVGLGLHDRWRETGEEKAKAGFLRIAEHFLRDRDPMGRWCYHFAWDRSPNPWYSSLAQSRGASVMLRAFRVTGRQEYADAARAGLATFALPLEQGGLRHTHHVAGVPYLEEYPFQPTGVLNGFMSSAFGLYEVGHWLDDAPARALLEEYLASLELLLPLYTTRWWTLYDMDPASPFPNVHSPRYHRLATDYLRVISAVFPRPAFTTHRDRWIDFDRPLNRGRAAALKTLKKLIHR